MEKKFNRAQLTAIHYTKGPLLVIAGPGSGKTTVIVNRAKYLIETNTVNPENLLVVTFSKSAAEEMKGRFYKEMNGSKLEYKKAVFCTIHSLCLTILCKSFGHSPKQVIPEFEKWEIIEKTALELRYDTEDMKQTIQSVLTGISYIKNAGITDIKNCDEDFNMNPSTMKQFYDSYQKELAKAGKFDFDDMLIMAYDYLLNDMNALRLWQRKFQYLMIDEYQDTNQIQAKLLYLLAKPECNICIVGDDDQSLYSFRGADPKLMLHFEEEFPETKKVVLDYNYRCARNIVEASSELVSHNKNRFAKELKAKNGLKRGIVFKIYENEKKQSLAVCKQAEELFKKGIPYEEMAVIYRTNKEATALVQTLTKADIEFNVRKEDVFNPFTHWIFKDIVNFYEVSKNVKTAPMSKIRLALKRPTRYIPLNVLKNANDLREIKQWGYNNNKYYIAKNVYAFEDDMKYLGTSSNLKQFFNRLKCIGYEEGISDYAKYMKQNEKELLDIYKSLKKDAMEYETMEEWIAHSIEYTNSLERNKNKTDEEKKGIRLLTMHSSKGLEWDAVFIINADEKITPFYRSNNIEEERRMFYVAMTRARKYLDIYSTAEYNGDNMEVSRFVPESYKKKEQKTG